MPIDPQRNFIPLRVAVLTVSDTRTLADDRSGDALVQRIAEAGHVLEKRDVVRDEIPAIQETIHAWSADPAIDVILSVGGTGLTGRDVTPEAILPLLNKELPGFGELFRALSYPVIGTAAMLSRTVGGVSGGTYVFALPGSTDAILLAWDKILVHQLDTRTLPGNLARLMPRLHER